MKNFFCRLLLGYKTYWANIRIWEQGETFELGEKLYVRKTYKIRSVKVGKDLEDKKKLPCCQVVGASSLKTVFISENQFNLWIKNAFIGKSFVPREHTIRSMSIEGEAYSIGNLELCAPSTSTVYSGEYFPEDIIELGRNIDPGYFWPTEQAKFDISNYPDYEKWATSRFDIHSHLDNPDNVLLAELRGIDLFEKAYSLYGSSKLNYIAEHSEAFKEYLKERASEKSECFFISQQDLDSVNDPEAEGVIDLNTEEC